MSYSLRDRYRNGKLRLSKKYNIPIEELNWLDDNYIEEICREGDLKCKKISPEKAVDQVIDEMDQEMFDKFIKGLIDELKVRLDKTKKLERKRKRNFEQESAETQVPLVYPNNTTPFERPQQMEATQR